MVRQGKLFIVSAPSGAGKTSLVVAAVKRLSVEHPIERVVTYTTKQPRPGETPGQDYHYISIAEFKTKIVQGFFIEWSVSYGHYYGSPRSILDNLSRGVSLVLVIDRAGARQVYAQLKDVVLIWIYTKDITTLQERLTNRATENFEQMRRRLQLAQEEIEEEAREHLYQYHILNEAFENALLELEYAILSSLKKAA